MARKRHAALTYEYCVQQYDKRIKSRDFKSILGDCKLYDRGTHFEIVHKKWLSWENTSEGYRKVTKDVSLATITPDDVLTMTYDDGVNMTVCNRLTSLTGWPVGLNKRSFSNHKQHVRVYCKDNGYQNSEPYFAGMKWDVKNGGAVLLNPQPDLKLVVDNGAVQKVKKEFDSLRKLTRTMLRIGAFDEFAAKYMTKRWDIKLDDYKSLVDIDPNNPIGDDALAIIAHGAWNINRPDTHHWDKNTRQYVKRSLDEVMREWLTKAMERGLKDMRRKAYENNDAYIEIAA